MNNNKQNHWNKPNQPVNNSSQPGLVIFDTVQIEFLEGKPRKQYCWEDIAPRCTYVVVNQ